MLRASYESGTRLDTKIKEMSNLQPHPLKKSKYRKGNRQVNIKVHHEGLASLVVQWLRICLPMQGTRVRALVWEDPTCHGATKPVRHDY